MRKFIAAIALVGLVGHAFAQSQPQTDQNQDRATAAAFPCIAGGGSHQDDQQRDDDDSRRGGAVLMPCGGAAEATGAATGNLTPLYAGATIVGAAVIAGALSGGDNHRHDPAPGSGSSSGTTGTH